jgi:hypothetical protein
MKRRPVGPLPYSRREIQGVFEDALIRYDGLRAAARALGLSAPYLSDLLNGERPGPKALAAIGYAGVEGYEKLPYTSKRGSSE